MEESLIKPDEVKPKETQVTEADTGVTEEKKPKPKKKKPVETPEGAGEEKPKPKKKKPAETPEGVGEEKPKPKKKKPAETPEGVEEEKPKPKKKKPAEVPEGSGEEKPKPKKKKPAETPEGAGEEKPKKKKPKTDPEKKEKKKKKVKLPPKVIVIENLGVKFRIHEQKVDNLKEYFVRLVKRELNYKEFWALKDINLKIRKGDRVGILGLNGAGKSTLLKCVAGVLKPTEGSVTVQGNIVPLLELGAGFDKDYTGAENIYLYGSMLGYSRNFINERFDEIVEFSELGNFINVPVKNYSSGMKARLGFSIATVVEPEILILDEVLSVGDAKFRKKSSKRLIKMMDKGVTVLFVSHSSDQVLANCNKALILDHGRLVAFGKTKKICAQYEEMLQ